MPRLSSFSTTLLASITICLATPCLADDPDDFRVMKNEALGELKLDMPAAQLKSLMAGGPAMGVKKLWEADGRFHQTWKYASLGVEIDMASDDRKVAQYIAGITVRSPSALGSRRGIHIGSRESDVVKAYKSDLNKEESQPGQSLVAGSLYGGIVFTIEKGTVATIFLGAAAE